MFQLDKVISAAIVLLFSSACISNNSEANRYQTATVDAMPTNTAVEEIAPSVVVEPTLQTPTRTSTPTPNWQNRPTSIPHPTDTPAPTPIFPFETQPDFLFDGELESCELPCWHGLHIRESSDEDIQHVFDTVLGFNGVYDPLFPTRQSFMPGYISSGYGWDFTDSSGYFPRWFRIDAYIAEDDRLLEGIEFYWNTEALNSIMSPKRIIQELGVPTNVLISFSRTTVQREGVMDLMIVYQEGIAFYYSVNVPFSVHYTNDAIDSIIASACLGGDGWYGDAFIIPPIEQGLPEETKGLDPLQYRFIGERIESQHLQLWSEFFDLTLEEFTNVALAPGDSCIQSVNLYHRD